MGMELHARSRRDLEPDPEFDPICALFYCLSSDAPLPDVDSKQLTGAIVVDKDYQSCDEGEVLNLLEHKAKPSSLCISFVFPSLHWFIDICYVSHRLFSNSSQ